MAAPSLAEGDVVEVLQPDGWWRRGVLGAYLAAHDRYPVRYDDGAQQLVAPSKHTIRRSLSDTAPPPASSPRSKLNKTPPSDGWDTHVSSSANRASQAGRSVGAAVDTTNDSFGAQYPLSPQRDDGLGLGVDVAELEAEHGLQERWLRTHASVMPPEPLHTNTADLGAALPGLRSVPATTAAAVESELRAAAQAAAAARTQLAADAATTRARAAHDGVFGASSASAKPFDTADSVAAQGHNNDPRAGHTATSASSPRYADVEKRSGGRSALDDDSAGDSDQEWANEAVATAARSYREGFVRTDGAAEGVAAYVAACIGGGAGMPSMAARGVDDTGLLSFCALRGQGLGALLPAWGRGTADEDRRVFVRMCLVQPPAPEEEPKARQPAGMHGATGASRAARGNGALQGAAFTRPPPQVNPLLCRRVPLFRTAAVAVGEGGDPTWGAGVEGRPDHSPATTLSATAVSARVGATDAAGTGVLARLPGVCLCQLGGEDAHGRQAALPPHLTGAAGAISCRLDWPFLGGYLLVQVYEATTALSGGGIEGASDSAGRLPARLLVGQGLLRVCDLFAGSPRRFTSGHSVLHAQLYGGDDAESEGKSHDGATRASTGGRGPVEFFLRLWLPLAPTETAGAAEAAMLAAAQHEQRDAGKAGADGQLGISRSFAAHSVEAGPPALLVSASLVLPVALDLPAALLVGESRGLLSGHSARAPPAQGSDGVLAEGEDQLPPPRAASRGAAPGRSVSVGSKHQARRHQAQLGSLSQAARAKLASAASRAASRQRTHAYLQARRAGDLPPELQAATLAEARAYAQAAAAHNRVLEDQLRNLRAAAARARSELAHNQFLLRQLVEVQPSPLEGLARATAAAATATLHRRVAGGPSGSSRAGPCEPAASGTEAVALYRQAVALQQRLQRAVADSAAVLASGTDAGTPAAAYSPASAAARLQALRGRAAELVEARRTMRARVAALHARLGRERQLDEALIADLRRQLDDAQAVPEKAM
jgi:hypothetical protein